MNDICGRPFSTLSASADLQSSLESKLRQQLDTDGSMIFALTWKQKVTPQGRSYCQLAASVRSTNGIGFSSWPTVTTQDNNQVAGVGAVKANPKRGTTLGGAVRLVPWVTPSARDWKDTKKHEYRGDQPGWVKAKSCGSIAEAGLQSVTCLDGKRRLIPVEPEIQPMVDGLPNHMDLIRGAGNAIVPQVAAEVVKAYMAIR